MRKDTKHTEETKKAIAEKMRGKTQDDTHRRAIADGMREFWKKKREQQ